MAQPDPDGLDFDAEALLVAVLDGVERDKAQTARRLHGDLGGALAAARMAISALRAGKAGPELLGQLDAQLAAAQAVEQQVVASLRPALLAHFGIAVALPAHAEAVCREAGVSLAVSVPPAPPVLDMNRQIVLYRFGEAALGTVLRAQPARLRLELGGRDDAIRLCLAYEAATAPIEGDSAVASACRWIRGLGGECSVRASGTDGELVASLRPGQGG
jgi:signal transduction histidine kinase